MTNERRIIHIDMDAFFAAVEQRDNPELVGKPVIVGGSPESRGVVATASYEARAYGVHSAMACARAKQLCPSAIFVRPRFGVYQRISRVLQGLFRQYTDLVEPIALDEAYLDVTYNKAGIRHASVIARQIQERIHQYTGLTASAGIGPNKFIAKAASGFRKPNGITIVRPERVGHFLSQLELRDIPGIGKVTHKEMRNIGINTIADLRSKSVEELTKHFGVRGNWFYSISRGQDDRQVQAQRERKSLGVEHTYSEDLRSMHEAKTKLHQLAEELTARVAKKDCKGLTLVLKVKFNDFSIMTRQMPLGCLDGNSNLDLNELFRARSGQLLEQFANSWRPIRLLGLSLRLQGLAKVESNSELPQQLTIF
jgi:DNA polymerase IV